MAKPRFSIHLNANSPIRTKNFQIAADNIKEFRHKLTVRLSTSLKQAVHINFSGLRKDQACFFTVTPWTIEGNNQDVPITNGSCWLPDEIDLGYMPSDKTFWTN